MDLCVICYDAQAVLRPCERCITRICAACDARVLPRVCITCRGPVQIGPFNDRAAMERIQQLYAACIKKLIQSTEYMELMHDIAMYELFVGPLVQIKNNIAAHIKRSATVISISRIICGSTIMYLTLALILSSITEFNLSATCLIIAYITAQVIRLSRFYFFVVSRVTSTLEITCGLVGLVYMWSVWPIFGSALVTISYVQHAASVLNFHFELFE